MNWRYNLQQAWVTLPDGIRRLVIGGMVGALGLIALSFVLPAESQVVPVVLLFVLMLVMQGIILWNMWQQNPLVRQARRLYMAADFEGVIELVEQAEPAAREQTMAAVLLGNAYRQMGQLSESERVLLAAHEADPDVPYAAYGLARTLLVMGQYVEAAELIVHALDKRGQPVIVSDLGHAQYRAGQMDAARASLEQADAIKIEPGRALLTRYLLWRLSDQPAGDDLKERLERYDHGIPALEVEAERFADTPYGAALSEDVMQIKALLGETDES
jgi:tetratricopeptide (TPR) repeat protein